MHAVKLTAVEKVKVIKIYHKYMKVLAIIVIFIRKYNTYDKFETNFVKPCNLHQLIQKRRKNKYCESQIATSL